MIKKIKDIKLAVIGLGYVGLPLALEFAKKKRRLVLISIKKELKNLIQDLIKT